MTIKLRTTLCGPDGALHPGEHTLDPAREKELVAAGFAEYVKRSGGPETATARRSENAATGHSARRGAKE